VPVLPLADFSQNSVSENHSDQMTSDNHNFCYRQTIKEIKQIWKGLEPSLKMDSKPVCQISPCVGFSQIASQIDNKGRSRQVEVFRGTLIMCCRASLQKTMNQII